MTSSSTRRPSKRQRLQRLADQLRAESCWEFTIEWRGHSWWGVPDHPEHFGDKGTFLGANYEQAKHTLELLLG